MIICSSAYGHEENTLFKQKLISKYVKAYLSELAKLVEKVPEETSL